jgi:radical SAM superfamily enzyme YgiQ (UPF0313 family)
VAGNLRRIRELCRELAPLGVHWIGQAGIHIARKPEILDLLVESGCRGLLLGMESLDPTNLRAMGKAWNTRNGDYAAQLSAIRNHGLAIYGTFLFGYDNDDRQAVQRSVDFARDQKLFLAAFNHLVPFPGTPVYARLLSEGRLPVKQWWLDPDGRMGDVTFEPRKISAEELEETCLDARRQFYSWRSIFRRMWDFKTNAQSLRMAGLYLSVNAQAHLDIDLRQGLSLGTGLEQRGTIDEQVSL